jgi:hypothetical protein
MKKKEMQIGIKHVGTFHGMSLQIFINYQYFSGTNVWSVTGGLT